MLNKNKNNIADTRMDDREKLRLKNTVLKWTLNASRSHTWNVRQQLILFDSEMLG